MATNVAQQERSNNKCYALSFKYIKILIFSENEKGLAVFFFFFLLPNEILIFWKNEKGSWFLCLFSKKMRISNAWEATKTKWSKWKEKKKPREKQFIRKKRLNIFFLHMGKTTSFKLIKTTRCWFEVAQPPQPLIGLSTSQARSSLCPTRTWPDCIGWGKILTHNRPTRVSGLPVCVVSISGPYRSVSGLLEWSEIWQNFGRNMAGFRQIWSNLTRSDQYFPISIKIGSRSWWIWPKYAYIVGLKSLEFVDLLVFGWNSWFPTREEQLIRQVGFVSFSDR